LKTLKKGKELNEPFSNILKELNIQNKFVTNWLDLLCFLLQGLPANGTMNAVVAYMMADWYRPGVTLDYPRGGSGAIVDALVRGLQRTNEERGQRGGRLLLRSHCEQVSAFPSTHNCPIKQASCNL
jgi:phytoene dehydrogenase-like protein